MEDDFIKSLGYVGFSMRLKRLSDSVLHSGRRLYKELNMEIEPNWFSVFKLLQKNEFLGVTEIADQIGMAHPSVISIINKMTEKGFIDSKKDDIDSRKRVLFLTDKAIEKIPLYEQIWAAGEQGLANALDEHNALDLLSKMEEVFEKQSFCDRTLIEFNKANHK